MAPSELHDTLQRAAITAQLMVVAIDASSERIEALEVMVLRLIDDAHRMHMIGPGYKDQAQAMLYAEAAKLIGK